MGDRREDTLRIDGRLASKKKGRCFLHRPLSFLFLAQFHRRNALFQLLDAQLNGLSVPLGCRLDFPLLLLAHLGLGSLTVVHKFLLEMVGADVRHSLVTPA